MKGKSEPFAPAHLSTAPPASTSTHGPGRALAVGGAVVLAGATVGHFVPAIASWRGLRCWAMPNLAGVGRADHVALTFDDGPDPASTPAFLDQLDRLGWKATFFLLGSMARRSRSLTQEVSARGHEIAVHGDEHRSHLHLTPKAVRSDVTRARDCIADITGVEPVWFRPPYGALSAGSLSSARDLGLRTVLWTTWGRDWRSKATSATVVADVTRGLRPGATVLLHDSDCTSDPQSWRATLGALPQMAELFAQRSLSVGTLSEHGIRAA